MKSISSLRSADRLEILKHLAVDDSGKVDLGIFNQITGPSYNDFENFCDKVFQEKEKVKEVSCIPDADTLRFEIEYQ